MKHEESGCRYIKIRGIETSDSGVANIICEEMENHFLVFMRMSIDHENDSKLNLTLIESVYDPKDFFPPEKIPEE
jgi:hypothetical protein